MMSSERAFKQAKQGMVSAPIVFILVLTFWYGINRFIIQLPRWILILVMLIAITSFVLDLAIYLKLRNSISKPKEKRKVRQPS